MKLSRVLPAVFVSLLPAALLRADPPPPQGAKAVPVFDGKSLAGWEGNTAIWSVKDGVITGGSLTETVKRNEFLATEKSYADFDLRLKIKITGKEGFINSGIQIRSQRVPNDSEMAGYQCDAGDGWWGKIYDESRRNKVIANPADEKALTAAIKKDDWNDYVIRAEGPRIRIWINGVPASDYTEQDPKIPLEGKLGLQVHGGGKALVQFKDITLEELPAPAKKESTAQSKKAE
jgi:hypothetical protein